MSKDGHNMSKARCDTCAFLDHSGPVCRRNAPMPSFYAITNEISDGDEYRSKFSGVHMDWPTVDPKNDWCGEYKPHLWCEELP